MSEAEQALDGRKLTSLSGLRSASALKMIGPVPEMLKLDVAQGQVDEVDKLVDIAHVRLLRVRTLAV